jgi:hypothetical protein
MVDKLPDIDILIHLINVYSTNLKYVEGKFGTLQIAQFHKYNNYPNLFISGFLLKDEKYNKLYFSFQQYHDDGQDMLFRPHYLFIPTPNPEMKGIEKGKNIQLTSKNTTVLFEDIVNGSIETKGDINFTVHDGSISPSTGFNLKITKYPVSLTSTVVHDGVTYVTLHWIVEPNVYEQFFNSSYLIKNMKFIDVYNILNGIENLKSLMPSLKTLLGLRSVDDEKDKHK